MLRIVLSIVLVTVMGINGMAQDVPTPPPAPAPGLDFGAPAAKGGVTLDSPTLYGECDKSAFGQGITEIQWMDPEKKSGRGQNAEGTLVVWRLYSCPQEDGGPVDIQISMGTEHEEQQAEAKTRRVYWVAFAFGGQGQVLCQIREEKADKVRVLSHALLTTHPKKKLVVRTANPADDGGTYELDSLIYCLERVYKHSMLTSDIQAMGFSVVFNEIDGYSLVPSKTEFKEREIADLVLDHNWWSILGMKKPGRVAVCCDPSETPTPAAVSASASVIIRPLQRCRQSAVQK